MSGENLKEGINGIARQGLGAYMNDVHNKLLEDRSQGLKAVASAPQLPIWAPERENRWRPGRVVCARPEIREPDKLSQRPPFVPRQGSHVTLKAAQALPTRYDDLEHDRYRTNALQRERRLTQDAAFQEAREAQDLVRGLEDWEREHVRGSAERHSVSSRGRLRGTARAGDATTPSPVARRLEHGATLRPAVGQRAAQGAWSGDATSQSLLQRNSTMRRSASDASFGLLHQRAM